MTGTSTESTEYLILPSACGHGFSKGRENTSGTSDLKADKLYVSKVIFFGSTAHAHTTGPFPKSVYSSAMLWFSHTYLVEQRMKHTVSNQPSLQVELPKFSIKAYTVGTC